MARVKGGLFTSVLDVNKRFPLDSRMLVSKREDLINPNTWITNTLTTEATYNSMIVSVNSDGEHNGVYYLLDRKAITADNYSAYKTAFEAGEGVDSYFSMWMKLGTLDDVATVEKKIKELIGEMPEGKTIADMIAEVKPSMNLVPVDGTMVISDIEDGGKAISVAIAPVQGNALVAVEGGLFVPTAVVPEYTIEKQEVVEDGFSASYRLKKIVGEDISYIGDAINIPEDRMLQSATFETVSEVDVPYVGALVGDPYIKMVFNNAEIPNLYIPVKSLVDIYTAGSGIEIVDNKVSVKLADTTHGLVAVDGALSINLATRNSDGAMSKEDKKILDSIPYVYEARKYDISDTPVGTLVDYGEHEIRIMCPADAEFTKQTVGTGGNANTYYITLKTYVPNDDVVGYIEHIGNDADAEVLNDIKIDECGRRYQPTWLGIATFSEATGAWTYYGSKSEESKYIGWDYKICWFDKNNVVVASDSIRINLSNESCHYNNKPYYMANYATSDEVQDLKEDMENNFTWGEM